MRQIKNIFMITFVLILINQTLEAQNRISGNIRTGNNEVLAGANIMVMNTTKGTASDSEGNYSITGLKNGEYRIRVSFFGYETVEKTVVLTGQPLTLHFDMNETTIDLNAVVVTGTRTEKSLKNTPVLTQTISSRELERKDATDITQALEMVVPGIEFSSSATGKTISLQGIDPQYMLFLVDGERLAGDTYGDIDYSRINMANIERIEVVKGASSTLYGSNALGGVVNIITKTPATPFGLSASARFSRYNTQNHRLSVGSKLGNFSTQTSVDFEKTDGYDLFEGNSYRTQEREDAIVVSERLRYSPAGNLQIEGNLSLMNKNRDNTSASLYNRRNTDFSYGAKATWFLNRQNNLTLNWYSDNFELLNKITPDSLVSDYNNLFNNARLLGNFNLANRNVLTVGAEYISENLTAPRNNIDNKSNTESIFFAQDDIQIGDDVNIIGGFRAHNNSEYGWHFTPQFSAMYTIWHFALRGNYGMGYKTPSLKEKYMSFQIPAPGPPMFLVGFEGLEPEKSRYASLSTEYTREGVSFAVSVYQNHISDMITENLDEYSVKPGGIIEYAYRNYDEVLLKGIDVLLKTKVARNLFFNGSVTFSKKYDQVEDREFENVRNFSGKFNLDYNMSKKTYGLNINLQSNFYGAKTILLMNETTHQTRAVELENFSLWKLTTTHTFKSNYQMRLGVENIFNYIDSSGGYNTGTPGRTFFVGLGITI
jgi:outer membrane receptor for ferrienterochelin and colicins